jgi:hypothetical protein
VIFTHFRSELGLGVNMKVVGMDVSFMMSLVSPQEDIHNVSYGQNTTQGSARLCDLPKFKKTNLSTILCTELDLGLFMEDVDKGVRFHLALDGIH